MLRFIVERQLPYASVYGDIVASDGENDYGATLIDCKLHCTGCQRTGCMFCAFGAHLEKRRQPLCTHETDAPEALCVLHRRRDI